MNLENLKIETLLGFEEITSDDRILQFAIHLLNFVRDCIKKNE